jgi:hypothetical protein
MNSRFSTFSFAIAITYALMANICSALGGGGLYAVEETCEPLVTADINGDCRVDFADLAILAAHWLSTNGSATFPVEDRWPAPPEERIVWALDKTAKAVITSPQDNWWESHHASVYRTTDDGSQILIWEGDLVNVPYQIFVSSCGKNLVTLDRWGRIGTDPVVIYNSLGQLVKRYLDPREEILTDEEIPWIAQSVSSYWWSEDTHAEFLADGECFLLWFPWGRVVVFDSQAGEQLDAESFRLAEEKRPKILHTINLLKESENPELRTAAARFAGWLGGKAVGPILRELVLDPYYRDGHSWQKMEDPYGRFGDSYMWMFPRRYPVRKAAAEEMHIEFGQADGIIEEWIVR